MKKKISIIVLLPFLILAACSPPAAPAVTATPHLTATPTSTPGIEVNVDGILINLTDVNFGKYMGTRVTDNKDDLGLMNGYEAKPGFRFAEVSVQITPGESAEEVSNWDVFLQDASGERYEVTVRGWGVFYGGPNGAGWTFLIQERASQLKLVFPGDISADLSSLLAE